jgi:hypothetical protein
MSENNWNNSFYLFARPSFCEGVARVLDLGGTLQIYNESKTEEEADLKAIENDWLAVGLDMKEAINKYGK